jgi:hypothetical protein
MAFPTIYACLICDLIRPELGNKTILIGFYGASPAAHINIANFKQPVQLCLAFCGGPGDGHFKIDLKVPAPNGQEFNALPIEGDLLQQSGVSNFFMGMQETFPCPGLYKATLLANGNPEYDAQFSLEQAQLPTAGATAGLPSTLVN